MTEILAGVVTLVGSLVVGHLLDRRAHVRLARDVALWRDMPTGAVRDALRRSIVSDVELELRRRELGPSPFVYWGKAMLFALVSLALVLLQALIPPGGSAPSWGGFATAALQVSVVTLLGVSFFYLGLFTHGLFKLFEARRRRRLAFEAARQEIAKYLAD